jgi:3-phenylpropionate/trans-cinnamate dioxygenase ferredoxin reductase component
MQQYKYLLIGGGMTADAAARGIRSVDRTGSIGLIGAEPDPPYNRPPLSKGLWQGRPLDKIWRNTEKLGVELHLGCTVVSIDPAGKTVSDDAGQVFGYERLLLATGGTVRRLPFGGGDILYLRTVADYRRLRALADRGGRVAVIGAGFVGSEIAAALATNGVPVTMIYPEQRIGERPFPPELSGFVTQKFQDQGVELLAGHTVANAERRGDELALQIKTLDGSSQRELVVAGAVAGLGIIPNLDLPRAAGIAVDNGILVDGSLRTSVPDIYAAGDVASFYNPILDRRLRLEHEDAANSQGHAAGQAMAGKAVNYTLLPFFYSDLFDLSYEAMGELDARLETFADWQVPCEQGVIYYLREGSLRGILLWNNGGQVDGARLLMAERRTWKPADLRGRLPE